MLKFGREEGIPYSFSRWTDVPAAKWAWFKDALSRREMVAFDPRDAIPYTWSLDPQDTLGMVFWTKDPGNLLRDLDLLRHYRKKVHVTITDWHEVEPGVPDATSVASMTRYLADEIGAENVTWRFSPVPLVPDVVERFSWIAYALGGMGAPAKVKDVYLSFLQTNDKIGETRERDERLRIMVELAKIAKSVDLNVRLCNEDRTLARVEGLPDNLSAGVCAPPEDFGQPGHAMPPSEGCGCVLMADPFTVNETCTMGCKYCYAADQSLAPKKRNTTKGLPVLP